METDRGLVEHVGDVGERAEVADHLGSLRLAPGQGSRRTVERQVPEPDLRERVQEVLQPAEQRRQRQLVEGADQSARSLTCIVQMSAMLFPSIFDDLASAASLVRRTRDRS